MSDFHRASLEMAWLCLCQITNESTKTENCYSSLNRELRWLWNSVYIYIVRLIGTHWQTLQKCINRTFELAA